MERKRERKEREGERGRSVNADNSVLRNHIKPETKGKR